MKLKLIIVSTILAMVLAKNDPKCGTKGPPGPPSPPLGRIIEGVETRPHEFPWQCQLAGSCGCSIINEHWILTAGHCVNHNDYIIDSTTILVGAHNLKHREGTELEIKSSKIIPHEKYTDNGTHLLNDIALIKLQTPLNLSSPALGSVCVPDRAEPLDSMAGKWCISTGWGDTKFDSIQSFDDSPVLLKVNMQVLSHAECKVKSNELTFLDQHICFANGNKGNCHGDSGGPLNCFVNNRWYVYGVTSYGAQVNCNKTGPDVDTRVSHFADWIWNTIKKN